MIASLSGRVQEVKSDHIVVEVGGVGLAVSVPAQTRDRLRSGEGIFLYTHLIVRQDFLALYGFETQEGRDYYITLLGVDGVGPRLALAVISTLSPDAIRRAVFHEQPEVFSRVPGVGKKTAQKILLHLQDRLPVEAGLERIADDERCRYKRYWAPDRPSATVWLKLNPRCSPSPAIHRWMLKRGCEQSCNTLGRKKPLQRREKVFQDKKVAFIGPGIMAEAMISGLIHRQVAPSGSVLAAGPRRERLDELQKNYRISTTLDNAEAARQADLVVLAVKPQFLNKVMAGVNGSIRADALVLSIVAGATIAKISAGLNHRLVVRSMPNTPAQIGEGITVWTASPEVSADQREMARQVLGSLGQEVFMEEENYLDMATALSGTGPAYVFLFMEAMVDAGVHLGLRAHRRTVGCPNRAWFGALLFKP
jgi:pyrroline-5-carboxylate reductase